MTFAACGDGEEEAPECRAVAAEDYDVDSGWGSGDYCASPTDRGCFPYHESAADTCGPFTTMRTSATSADDVAACRTILDVINCGTYADDAGTSLTFHVEEPDRFTARMLGTLRGTAVDTTLYFNPCQQGCLGAVSLETFDEGQQRVCDIPRMGKPVCLFPETAHVATIARVDATSMEIRTSSGSLALARSD